jgi:ribose transport system substrate-binding protein
MHHRTLLALFTILGLTIASTGCRDGGKERKEQTDVAEFAAMDVDLGNGYTLLSTQIDDSSEPKCQAKAEDLLLKHPDVACLIGLWEYNPPALLRAVQNSKSKPAIVAFDENDQTLNGIKSGAVVGTIVQDPYEFGYQSIKVLAALTRGNDDLLKNWPGIEKDNSIFVPARVITKDNLEAFEADVKKILEKKTNDKPGGVGNAKPKVAFVSNNAYQFWTFAQKGAEKAASEFDVELEFRKPEKGTVEVQRQILEDLINRGFTGVAVSPNEPTNTLSFYKNTVAKKMALVMTDNDLPDPSARKCYIGTHNYRAGRAAGELVKKAIPNGGKIAIFVGRADSPNAIERRQGVLDFLAGKDRKGKE